MDLPRQFVLLSHTLNNIVNLENYNKTKVNSLINELDSLPYSERRFVRRHVAIPLVTSLYLHIKPNDELLSVKTSHLINSVLTKQSILFGTIYHTDFLWNVISWHIDCLKQCPDIVLPDILQNMQGILRSIPAATFKSAEDLIGKHGILIDMIDTDSGRMLRTENPLQTCLIALKCILSVVSNSKDYKDKAGVDNLAPEAKENISHTVVQLLIKLNFTDEFLYSKVVITALRVLFQLYSRDKDLTIPLPEVMGICRRFILYGLVTENNELEAIAGTTLVYNLDQAKDQNHMEKAKHLIECLKKDTPVSTFSPMIIDDIENNDNLLQEAISCCISDSNNMSDVEKNKKAESIASMSKVRESASRLLLFLIKVQRREDILSNWWAHLPCSPVFDWTVEESIQKTLTYCVRTDPIVSSRVSVLRVIVALFKDTVNANLSRLNKMNVDQK